MVANCGTRKRGSRKPSTAGAATAASYQDLGAMSNGIQRIRTNKTSQPRWVRSAVICRERKSHVRIINGSAVNAATKANATNGAATHANSNWSRANATRIKNSTSMPLTPNATSADQRHQTIPIRAGDKRRLLPEAHDVFTSTPPNVLDQRRAASRGFQSTAAPRPVRCIEVLGGMRVWSSAFLAICLRCSGAPRCRRRHT